MNGMPLAGVQMQPMGAQQLQGPPKLLPDSPAKALVWVGYPRLWQAPHSCCRCQTLPNLWKNFIRIYLSQTEGIPRI